MITPADAPSWRCCPFDALSLRELHDLLRARQQVFAIEQNCVYLDIDGADEHCLHLAAWRPGGREPLAYARIVPPGLKYAEASIGRVITTAPGRGLGLGRELMRRAVAAAREWHPGHGLRISAQSYLEGFYGGFGFQIVGERYLEDGIPHTEMLLGPG